jgi:multiple sugar transport system permease protein
VKRPLATAIVNGLLVALAVLSIAPLLWMLSVSFMQTGEATHFPPPLLPSAPTLHNYHELFARAGMGRYLFNSFLVSTCVTLLALFMVLQRLYIQGLLLGGVKG